MTQFHSFSVDGLPLTETDDLGCDWAVSSLAGWFAGAGVRGTTVARSQQGGDWRSRQYRGGRVFTLTGDVLAPNTVALEECARRLSSVLAEGVFGDLVGDSPVGALTSLVQLEDEPLFDPVGDRYATWQLTVASESPLLFGSRTFGRASLDLVSGSGASFPWTFPVDFGVPDGMTPGSVFLPNAGSASYFPLVQVDGPTTNPVITLAETGAQVRLRGPIGAGQFVEFDMGRRTARLASRSNPDVSVSVRDRVTFSGSWPAVPVGGGSLSWTADSYGPNHLMSVWGYEGAWS